VVHSNHISTRIWNRLYNIILSTKKQ